MTIEFSAEDVLAFLEDADSQVEALEAGLLAAEERGEESAPEGIHEMFRAAHSLKGGAALLGLGPVAALTHRAENLLGAVREGKACLSEPVSDLLLQVVDRIRAMLAEVRRDPALCRVTEPQDFEEFCRELDTRIEGLERGESGPGDAVAGQPGAGEGTPPELAAQSCPGTGEPRVVPPAAGTSGGPGTRSVRVDAERLDTLLDVVGELVTATTRIRKLGADLERDFGCESAVADLAESIAHLERLMGELQHAVLRARMVPVERILSRFPRLVRDLARALDKDIRLEVAGGDTELDRTVIEEIESPLIHLLRNAADHGIERPEIRLCAGKPPFGTIRVSARREGNQISLAIEDDGGGIDRQQVLQQARRLGMIGEDADPGEAEVLRLLFRPGFSTAGKVTEISGRGVGLDAVEQAIRRIKGTIQISSQPGIGTRFAIRLPLTLASAKALLVRAGGATYALAIESIRESVRLAERDIQTIGGAEVVRLRDRAVPILRLPRLLGDVRQGARAARFPAVVAASGEKHVALVVDDLVGEQDIVIKALGGPAGPGAAGATILDDGRVALVLDVESLLSLCEAGERGRRGRSAARIRPAMA